MSHPAKLFFLTLLGAACTALAPPVHADGVKDGKQAAEQCVKYQKARSDKQIQACCADLLDGQGGKSTQQQCVKEGKEMARK
ncbi:hypothetical protein [Variovorax terrae]|uniref:PsiF repeat-containing protein n=1 Tax=Variovorax terrae TaxID=2923278 RepID=A0A9X1W190_9BURK|nr:hypothetical protein [Variovorax terrae]MCJ0765857.1 hypothetical protein [Variovorax terrae]